MRAARSPSIQPVSLMTAASASNGLFRMAADGRRFVAVEPSVPRMASGWRRRPLRLGGDDLNRAGGEADAELHFARTVVAGE
jgi:hypothetical protein